MFFQRLLFIFFFKQKPVFLLQGLARVLFSFLKVSGNIQALESYQSILGMLSDTEEALAYEITWLSFREKFLTDDKKLFQA